MRPWGTAASRPNTCSGFLAFLGQHEAAWMTMQLARQCAIERSLTGPLEGVHAFATYASAADPRHAVPARNCSLPCIGAQLFGSGATQSDRDIANLVVVARRLRTTTQLRPSNPFRASGAAEGHWYAFVRAEAPRPGGCPPRQRRADGPPVRSVVDHSGSRHANVRMMIGKRGLGRHSLFAHVATSVRDRARDHSFARAPRRLSAKPK